MKNVGIKEACSENWNEMTPTEKGAFCQKCVKQVIDFTGKTPSEIRMELLLNKGNSVCARITTNQETLLNKDFDLWKSSTKTHLQRASLYAFIIVFGLNLISCNDRKDELKIVEFQQKAIEIFKPTLTLPLEEEKEQKIESMIPEVPVISDDEENEIFIEYEKIKVQQVEERAITCKVNLNDLPDFEGRMLGAMILRTEYIDYLEQVVPTETPEEYDANGRLIPTEFATKAYPNPTNSFSTIQFDAPEKVDAQIMVFNMNGQLILDYGLNTYERGSHDISLDLQNSEPGIYLVVINSTKFKETIRISKI